MGTTSDSAKPALTLVAADSASRNETSQNDAGDTGAAKSQNPASAKAAAAGKKKTEHKPLIPGSEHFVNRELSQLKFNLRVLSEASNPRHPLLERLMFLLIFSSNLDEFFEIRVSGLKKQSQSGRDRPGPDGNYPDQILSAIHGQVREALDEQYRILNEDLFPSLADEGIHFLPRAEWSDELEKWAANYFQDEVLPVVSPLGLDPAHPFPRLVNKSLNFILSLEGKDAFGRESGLAVVPAPRSLPRLIKIPREIIPEGDNFVFLSSIVHAHVDQLFPGMTVRECHQFRVTRNSDLELTNAEVDDIASAVQGELVSRRFGAATKLEVSKECPEQLYSFLLQRFNLSEDELFKLDGPVNLQRLMALNAMVDRPDLRYPKFTPGLPQGLDEFDDIFAAVANDDQVLLHPFESFMPIIDWVRQAAKDPDVVAIKQTLYRTNESSELVEALAEAAYNGKEVTVVVEVRARFDEEDNLKFASILQEAGAVVVYGVLGYKTHAKMLLIVRREGNKLRRYAHLGTGNYHRKNSRIYTDYSLLTADKTVCADVHKLFQQITGMGKKIHPKTLVHAPFALRKSLLKLIDGEIEAAQSGKRARIIAKINGLTDLEIIKALYKASQAGVKIDLIVRGMCCLKPGIKGLSDKIRVVSVVGRFLEHSRVYHFRNAECPVYCASADLMERNLTRRIEVCFPILKKKLASRILDELSLYLRDSGQTWTLRADGEYEPPSADAGDGPQDVLLARLARSS